MVAADCFAAGLLHDVGSAFLHGFDLKGHLELIELHGTDGAALAAAESERFGMGHDAAAAHVLATWKFPAPFVEAVAWHHHPTENHPLAQAVHLGDLLAQLSEEADSSVSDQLIAAGVPFDDHEELITATGDRAAEILSTLPI
jgi:HD-like signal output (HDOD) protein